MPPRYINLFHVSPLLFQLASYNPWWKPLPIASVPPTCGLTMILSTHLEWVLALPITALKPYCRHPCVTSSNGGQHCFGPPVGVILACSGLPLLSPTGAMALVLVLAELLVSQMSHCKCGRGSGLLSFTNSPPTGKSSRPSTLLCFIFSLVVGTLSEAPPSFTSLITPQRTGLLKLAALRSLASTH